MYRSCRPDFRRLALVLLLAAGTGASLATPLRSGDFACDDAGFRVTGSAPGEAATICAILRDLRDALAPCGLAQVRPLAVQVVAQVEHPSGTCFAAYDCHYEVIRVLDPAAYSTAIPAEQPYARLPASVTLRAFLAHELAHALATQSAPRPLAPVDQEYIAAAMEIETMEPGWRAVYLAAIGPALPPGEGLIDIWIYALAPRDFAANAWRHFALPGNGCGLVARIVAGEASFARPR